jgi:hypothetical protein
VVIALNLGLLLQKERNADSDQTNDVLRPIGILPLQYMLWRTRNSWTTASRAFYATFSINLAPFSSAPFFAVADFKAFTARKDIVVAVAAR